MWNLGVIGLIVSLLATPLIPLQASSSQQNKLTLTDCQYEIGYGKDKQALAAKCGILSVPEDRSNPSSRQIEIHVRVLPKRNAASTATPVFHFEGGPGGSAIKAYASWVAAYEAINAERDIVLIDQRGTGSSASLQCTEISGVATKDLAETVEGKAALNLTVERMQACLKRLSKTNDPAFYNSLSMADDTDAVRAALGYDQINIFGNSYGTWLAQAYLRRHADHVASVTLDSPTGPWNAFPLAAGTSGQLSLDNVIALCEADVDCNKLYPNLKQALEKALANLDGKPVRASGTGGITGTTYTVWINRERLLGALFSSLYSNSNFGTIPKTITDASKGNYTAIASAIASAAEAAEDISQGLYYSVMCSEWVPFLTDDTIKRYDLTQFNGISATAVDEFRSVCKVWRAGEVSADEVSPLKSEKPILILQGAFDPITPVSFGKETQSRYPNSTLAIFPYQGHGPMVFNRCAQRIFEAFLDQPAGKLDTSCTAKDIKPLFSGTVKFDFVPFSDPAVPISLRIPAGWQYDANRSTKEMTFFNSPDGLQAIGVATFTGKTPAQIDALLKPIIGKAYGPTYNQLTLDVLGSRVIQQSVAGKDRTSVSILAIAGLFGNYTVFWYAAPSAYIGSTVEPILQVISSIAPRR
jgi:pimeloyl-ACP methyl ester carboxylesterase